MNLRIALDPKLDLSADEFVAAWNVSAHGQHAPAVVDTVSGESFLSPEISLALITAAIGIPVTVFTDFVSEYLKKKFIKKDAPKVTTTTITTPEGEPVLVITTVEEPK